ncbi:hypothetical protein HDU83_000364 [Entophlyctis luteolus]|nr:hypothetical protein HDU83_000364 [Entophlyctis luteolus]
MRFLFAALLTLWSVASVHSAPSDSSHRQQYPLLVAHAEIGSVPRITGVLPGSLFVDEWNRVRILRGTNVVYKAFPYVPDIRPDAPPRFSFNQDDVNILKEHATTVIRLGVMWPGVEPERGQYNHTYLETMKSIVQMCSDAGIYVLLDFHQDIFSEKFCGEGVPLFAAQPPKGPFGFPFPLEVRGYPVNEYGIPSIESCEKHPFAIYQGTRAVSEAYQRLYENYDGLRDAFIDYWKLVAKTFLPFKNILGYDLINEPWNGDVFKDPSLSNALIANRKNLQPFYDYVAEGIRSVDPEAIIFFEPVATVQKTVGFTKVPGGESFARKSVLSFHYYTSVNKQLSVNETIRYRVEQSTALGCGSLMGEFEMGWVNGTLEQLESIRETSASADSYFLSYTGWEYTDYIKMTGTNNGIRNPKSGHVRPEMAKLYSRAYASAIAGTPKFMEFIDETGEFTLIFVFNGITKGPGSITEIRTNFGLHYPTGHYIKVQTTNMNGSYAFGVLNVDIANGIVEVGPKDPNTAWNEDSEVEVTVKINRT